jgi:hypothetical protein
MFDQRGVCVRATRANPDWLLLAAKIAEARRARAWYRSGKSKDHPMKVFRIVAVITLLTGPAYAQTPELIHSFGPEKTPQQKADDELREKYSKESQSPKKIPQADAKTSIDPWGNARGGDAAKSSPSKTSNSKTSNSKKQGTKTGTDTD